MLGSFFSILGGVGYFFGKCINDAANQQLAEAEYVKSGRKERDRLYNIWMFGRYKYEKDELKKRARRWPGSPTSLVYHISKEANLEIAVNQIALKEGWDYHTNTRGLDLLKGPYFIDFLGEEWRNKKYCTYKEVAQAMNEETERREEWRKRCPRSNEVNVYPMDCDNEDEYREKVKRALTDRWYHKYDHDELPKGLDAYDYEDEEDFLKEKERLDQYYGRYQSYRKAERLMKHYVSSDLSSMENLVSHYDTDNITQDNIEEMFGNITSDKYLALEEVLNALGYTISYDTNYRVVTRRNKSIVVAEPPNPKLLSTPKGTIPQIDSE